MLHADLYVDTDESLVVRTLFAAEFETLSGIVEYRLSVPASRVGKFKTIFIPTETFWGAGVFQIDFSVGLDCISLGVNGTLVGELPADAPDLSSVTSGVAVTQTSPVVVGEVVTVPLMVYCIDCNQIEPRNIVNRGSCSGTEQWATVNLCVARFCGSVSGQCVLPGRDCSVHGYDASNTAYPVVDCRACHSTGI